MNHTDDDLTVLGSFRADLAEPDRARLMAIRARVDGGLRPTTTGRPPTTDRRTTIGRPMTGRRRATAPALVAAAAAATLVVVAVAAAVGLANGSAGDGGERQQTPGSASAVSAGSAAPETKPVAADGHQAAADLLLRLADEAGTGPAPITVAAGKLLYVKGSGPSGSLPSVHEMWVDPEGAIALSWQRTDGDQPSVSSGNQDPEIAEARSRLATYGPSLRYPTPAYLASLPTDPAALLGVLTAAGPDGTGPWLPGQALAEELSVLLYRVEPLLTAQVRAAFYRVLAQLPSVTSSGEVVEVEGRRVYVVGQPAPPERGAEEDQLLLDAQTGRPVGQRLTQSGAPVHTSLWSFTVVDTVGATS